MKTTTLNIICELTPTLFVALARLRENQGHDDSLPYQADIYIGEKASPKEDDIHFKKIGYVYNDGWGGQSEIRAEHQDGQLDINRGYFEKIGKECSKHDAYYKGKPFMKYNKRYLFDLMAEGYLYSNMKRKTLGYWFDDHPNVLDKTKNPNHYNCYVKNECPVVRFKEK